MVKSAFCPGLMNPVNGAGQTPTANDYIPGSARPAPARTKSEIATPRNGSTEPNTSSAARNDDLDNNLAYFKPSISVIGAISCKDKPSGSCCNLALIPLSIKSLRPLPNSIEIFGSLFFAISLAVKSRYSL